MINDFTPFLRVKLTHFNCKKHFKSIGKSHLLTKKRIKQTQNHTFLNIKMTVLCKSISFQNAVFRLIQEKTPMIKQNHTDKQ